MPPSGSGVYRMIGSEGEVLYVGKARSIKKRIAAYMAPERQPGRIARMVAQTPLDGVRHHRVGTPRRCCSRPISSSSSSPATTSRLRDDKSFPYILICTGHPGGGG